MVDKHKTHAVFIFIFNYESIKCQPLLLFFNSFFFTRFRNLSLICRDRIVTKWNDHSWHRVFMCTLEIESVMKIRFFISILTSNANDRSSSLQDVSLAS